MSANDRRRAYGTGSLELRTDSHGRETYYGRFRTGGKQHKVKLGEKRKPGEKTGLTKSAAERRCRRSSTTRSSARRSASASILRPPATGTSRTWPR
ncbi:MAG: hypothetical protein H0U33_07150 [Solirubrobacterales bacterium]|nr:hypothetical protein [Solirubrobacterales bacterium]